MRQIMGSGAGATIILSQGRTVMLLTLRRWRRIGKLKREVRSPQVLPPQVAQRLEVLPVAGFRAVRSVSEFNPALTSLLEHFYIETDTVLCRRHRFRMDCYVWVVDMHIATIN